MSGATPKPGPTQAQWEAVGELTRVAMNAAIAEAERMLIPGAHALVVEHMARLAARYGDDMFRYVDEEVGDHE